MQDPVAAATAPPKILYYVVFAFSLLMLAISIRSLFDLRVRSRHLGYTLASVVVGLTIYGVWTLMALVVITHEDSGAYLRILGPLFGLAAFAALIVGYYEYRAAHSHHRMNRINVTRAVPIAPIANPPGRFRELFLLLTGASIALIAAALWLEDFRIGVTGVVLFVLFRFASELLRLPN